MDLGTIYTRNDTTRTQDAAVEDIARALSAGHDDIDIYHLAVEAGGGEIYLLARHESGADLSIQIGNGGVLDPSMDRIVQWADEVTGQVSAPANSTILPWRLTSEGITLAAFDGYPSEDLVTALVDDLSDEWTVTWKGEAI